MKVEIKRSRSQEELKREEQRLIVEIAKSPKESNLYEILGNVYMEMGNFADALESFKSGLSFDKENESLRFKLMEAERKRNSK